MEFTFSAYGHLIDHLIGRGYHFGRFGDPAGFPEVILRHDLDFSISMAIPMAELEHARKVPATYFVLLTSQFYNANDHVNANLLRRLVALGHTVGLHFDRTRYGDDFNSASPGYVQAIMDEKQLLERIIGRRVDCVSMHQPAEDELKSGVELPGLYNAYSKEYFEHYDYYSDSVMTWRKDVLGAVCNSEPHNLQILTHPFWYGQTDGTVRSRLTGYISKGDVTRRELLKRVCSYYDEYMADDEAAGNE